jgi:hypothetical protein
MSVGRLSKLLLDLASTVLVSGLVGPHEHILIFSTTSTSFETGPPLRIEEGLTAAFHSAFTGCDSNRYSLIDRTQSLTSLSA